MTIHQRIRAAAFLIATVFVLTAVPTSFGQSPAQSGSRADLGGENAVQNGLFLRGNETYRVVKSAGFQTAADVESTPEQTVAQVGFNSGCGSCAISSRHGYGSSCSSCSSGGVGGCNSGFADACTAPTPYHYISIEGLYMDNDAVDQFSLSPDFGVGDFQHEFGSRITIGSVPDRLRGYEISFVSPMEWDRSRSLSDPTGIESDLRPAAGGVLGLLDLSSFLDLSEFSPGIVSATSQVNDIATEQNQIFEADYWSFEANRTCYSGDFARLLFGTRYINYGELYAYNSRSPGVADRPAVPPVFPTPGQPAIAGRPAGSGQLLSRTNNDLFGLQVGIDLLYPISRNGYADFRGRAGAFLNNAENQFRFANVIGEASEFQLISAADTRNFAGVLELGFGIRYQLGEILSVRAGTELWYLDRIASATSQFTSLLSDTTGSRTAANDSIFLTGISFGAELKY